MKRSFTGALSTIIGLVLISTLSLASERNPFKSSKIDINVPEKCQEYLPSYFIQEEITYFTVGSMGSTRSGFSAEVPIERGEATLLWRALNPNSSPNTMANAVKAIKRDEEVNHFYELLLKGREEREAQYYSEGEILEILTYSYLPESEMFQEMIDQHINETGDKEVEFFLTGGVSYHSRSGQTLGELDVILGDAKTCSIFGIGEAKLGRKRSKALRQLDRIKSFIRKL